MNLSNYPSKLKTLAKDPLKSIVQDKKHFYIVSEIWDISNYDVILKNLVP